LYENQFTAHTLSGLLGSSLAETLHSVNLGDCGIGSEELSALASIRNLNGLQNLDISSNVLRSRSIRTLLKRDWPALASLHLFRNRFGPDTGRDIAMSRNLRNLRVLNLSANGAFGDDGLSELSRSTELPCLSSLFVGHCRIGGAGLAALFGSELSDRLTRLHVYGMAADRDPLAVLGAAELPSLRSLGLARNRIGEPELISLLAADWAPRLTHLDLDTNVINAAAAERLATTTRLPAIECLYLCDNPIPPASQEHLRARFGDRVILDATGVRYTSHWSVI